MNASEAGVPRKIRLLIVDDSEVVRVGLRALLQRQPGLEIAAEAGSVAEAVKRAASTRLDVALVDIRLPDGTGFDACRAILKSRPQTRVVMLTSAADQGLVDEAIRAGAQGYLLKEIDAAGLVKAIRDAAEGRSTLDSAVAARVVQLAREGPSPTDPLEALSPQERRVLALVAEGRTNKEAASELGLTEKTVKNYLSRVFEKLNVSRRAEAAALYARDSRPR